LSSQEFAFEHCSALLALMLQALLALMVLTTVSSSAKIAENFICSIFD
jgi:hypothetical protein